MELPHVGLLHKPVAMDEGERLWSDLLFYTYTVTLLQHVDIGRMASSVPWNKKKGVIIGALHKSKLQEVSLLPFF